MKIMALMILSLILGAGAVVIGLLVMVTSVKEMHKSKEIHKVVKTNPCQFETIQEGMTAVGGDCDSIIVRDASLLVDDSVDEFEIHYNVINGKQPKPKYYKRIDGIIKEVKPENNIK